MATITINSKNHGLQEFTVNTFGGYVRCNGKQICDGGKLSGSTISIHLNNNQKNDVCFSISDKLETVAQKWWRQYLRNQRS